jgi:hypothetical protein
LVFEPTYAKASVSWELLSKKKQSISELLLFFESPLPESNQRPTDYKSVALPAELRRPYYFISLFDLLIIPKVRDSTQQSLSADRQAKEA